MVSSLLAFFSSWFIFGSILGLHLALPARLVNGYVKSSRTGAPLTYRLNGLLVFVVSIVIWIALGRLGVTEYTFLYENIWLSVSGACSLGIGASALLMLKASPVTSSRLKDFYLGRRLNPQYFQNRVDAKMYLYLAGATLLGLNLLSALAAQSARYGEVSENLLLHVALFFFFLIDYFSFERVHLYTYDLFAERVGFKLTWGCFTFYPYFYCLGLCSVAELAAAQSSPWYLGFCTLLFLSGWLLSRGANLQKYFFKRRPKAIYLGLIAPEVVSDGERQLLCNGFWGLSRHVNYLGEILMALGLSLALGHPEVVWTWLYPLYYLLLLLPRERDDDRRCAKKYGPLWDEYKKRVPYRVIPWIY